MRSTRTREVSIPLHAQGQQARSSAPVVLSLGIWSNFYGLEATQDGRTATVTFDASDAAPGATQVTIEATEGTADTAHALPDGGTLRAWLDGDTLRFRIESGWMGPDAPPPFELPASAHALPPALAAAAQDHADLGNPLIAAGIVARHALHRSDEPASPLLDAALGWWRDLSQDPGQSHSQARFAEELGFALLEDLESVLTEIEHLADEDLERLAIRRDDLASACSMLRLVGAGAGARAVQHRVDEALREVFARHTGARFRSPLLATVAAHRGGWWAVAPGAEPPPAAASAWDPCLDDDLAWAEEFDAVFAPGEAE